MTSPKKTPNTKLIRIKTKLSLVWLCLSIVFLLITLSIMFGITNQSDWLFWGG